MRTTTLVESKKRFLEAQRVRGLSPASLENRGGALDRFFAYLATAGVDDVRAITRDHLRGWLLTLAARSPWTRLAYLSAARAFFAFLEQTDAVLVNPCAGMGFLRSPDRLPRRVLRAAQVKAILAVPDAGTLRGRRDRAMLEVVYSTGLRRAELARLSVYDLDLAQGYVRVTRGKGGKDRLVPLGRTACAAVRVYLEKTRAKWIGDNPQTALWLDAHRPHGPLKVASVGELLSDLASAAGVRASAHVWRHTCATQLVNGGAALPFVQRLLGHASLETTQIYTRVAPKEVQAMHRQKHPRRSGRAPEAPSGAVLYRYRR